MSMVLHDHLGLLEQSLAERQLIVFTGMSGSGKSSYIELLLDKHPDFQGRAHSTIRSEDLLGPTPDSLEKLVVIDELQRVRDLRPVVALLRQGHALLVASHLNSAWVSLFGLTWPAANFDTDRSAEKLKHYLHQQGVCFSARSVEEFCRLYGANYTDVDIVLERSGGDDFDRAFERFRRSASIELQT